DRKTDGQTTFRLVDHDRKLIMHSEIPNDWFSLSRVLIRPSAKFTLHRVSTKTTVPGLGPCRWFALEYAGTHEDICWSTHWGVPLIIERSSSASKTGRARTFSLL